MLTAWQKSKACNEIASGTKEWRFLSSFGRENQLGADISQRQTWSKVQEEASAHLGSDAFESQSDIEEGKVGEVLTSTLLVGFLGKLGLASDASVKSGQESFAYEAMTEHQLSPGWFTKCPKEDASANAGALGTVKDIGVAAQDVADASSADVSGFQPAILVVIGVMGVIALCGAVFLILFRDQQSPSSQSSQPPVQELEGTPRLGREVADGGFRAEPLKTYTSVEEERTAIEIATEEGSPRGSPRTLGAARKDTLRMFGCGCCTRPTKSAETVSAPTALLMAQSEA